MYLKIFIHVPKCAGSTIKKNIEGNFSSSERFCLNKPHYEPMYVQVTGNKDWSKSKPVKRSVIKEYIASLNASQKEKIHCVYGHATYYNIHQDFQRDAQYFTLLRDPLSRLISYYNYIRSVRVSTERLISSEIQKKNGEIRSIDAWLEEANLIQYSISSFLLHTYQNEELLQDFPVPTKNDVEHIKQMLSSFYFVGLTEEEEDMDFTLGSFGIKTILPDRNVLRKQGHYMMPQDMENARRLVEERIPFDVELYKYAKKISLEKKEQFSNFKEIALQTRAQRELQIKK